MRRIIIATTTLWVINEIVQFFVLFDRGGLMEFSAIHLSSLYGAIIFCFLITHLKMNKLFILSPLAIELSESWLTCKCIDYWDLLFSLIGICTAIWILVKEKKTIKKRNRC